MKLPKKPEYFAGIKVDGAYERFKKLEEEEKAKSKDEIKLDSSPANINNYIYVPPVNLYIAKQRTHLGANWYDCHKQLHQENLLMPTILQFIAYINYLKQNPNGIPSGDASKQEIESILDDILTVRDPWRAEWFDAFFTKQSNKLYINYNHKTDSSGNLTPQNSEILEKCLMEDCYADVLNGNKQGLPLRKLTHDNGGIYYWHPIENYVAAFGAGSGGGSDLECGRDPSVSVASLGVFASFQRS